MFNIFNPIKKIIGVGKKDKKSDDNKKDDSAISLSKVSSLFEDLTSKVSAEYSIIRHKMKDLSKTNYDLGISHLEKGNISEARFRFWIVKKFWPEMYDAYYQLSYCLIMLNRPYRAAPVIEQLLKAKPEYRNKIDNLLESIQDDISRTKIQELVSSIPSTHNSDV